MALFDLFGSESIDSIHTKLKNRAEVTLRDIKLSMITDDIYNFEPNIDIIRKKNFFFNKKYWRIIKKYKSDCIITGSIALKSFGLIGREPSDIDFILIDSDNTKLIKELNTSRFHRKYDGEIKSDLIGSKKEGDYILDFFKNDKASYIVKDGFKFQIPLEIISNKINMMSSITNKNYSDMLEILNKLDKLKQ